MSVGQIKRELHFTGRTEFSSFPFTAPSDGIMVIIVVPDTSAMSAFYVNDNGSACARGAYVGGQNYTITFPAVKGHTYAIASSTNVRDQYRLFYPLA